MPKSVGRTKEKEKEKDSEQPNISHEARTLSVDIRHKIRERM